MLPEVFRTLHEEAILAGPPNHWSEHRTDVPLVNCTSHHYIRTYVPSLCQNDAPVDLKRNLLRPFKQNLILIINPVFMTLFFHLMRRTKFILLSRILFCHLTRLLDFIFSIPCFNIDVFVHDVKFQDMSNFISGEVECFRILAKLNLTKLYLLRRPPSIAFRQLIHISPVAQAALPVSAQLLSA